VHAKASRIRSNDYYDAVVIGAGLGGLGAALELAPKGIKLLLLEQHNLPGGFATSFVRGRFEFEPSLHQLPGTPPLTGMVGIKDYLVNEAKIDIDFVPVPEAYRLILSEDSVDILVPFGIDDFIASIEAQVPGSREAVTDYLALCRELLMTLAYLDKHRENLNKRELVKKYRSFLNTAAYTVEEVTNAMKIPQQARNILYPYWCYLGVPMSRLSFTIWGAMLYTYISAGAYVPLRRSHELASALLKRIEDLGGRVQFNKQVNEILVEKGRVRGVRTSAGETIKTSHVISNASPTLVFNRLISPKKEVPDMAFRMVNARIHGVSTFVVYLGLDVPKEELGLTDYSYFISPNMNTNEIYESTKKLKAPKMQASICLNNAVPDCSPPGTTILSLTTCYRPEAWYDIKPGDYFRVKNNIARGMIEQFEDAVGVNLKDHIEEIEVATPQTFARYTGSYNGIVYGYEPEPWDSIIPRALSVKKENYIQGLRFCGGFSYRCHGYGSSVFSGKSAAEHTLADMKCM